MATTRRLLEFRRSPNAIKVRIALQHKGLDFEPEEMSADDRSPMIEAANWPLIPVLIDGDVVMRDSEAILHYLECNYRDRPSLSLHDRDAIREAEGLHREFLGRARPLMVEAFAEMQKPEDERDAARLAEVNRRVQEPLRLLDERLSGRRFLFADRMTMWDVILACSLIPLRAPAEFIGQSPMWSFFADHFSIDDELADVRRWHDEIVAIDGLRAD